jgi:hypothetical protein
VVYTETVFSLLKAAHFNSVDVGIQSMTYSTPICTILQVKAGPSRECRHAARTVAYMINDRAFCAEIYFDVLYCDSMCHCDTVLQYRLRRASLSRGPDRLPCGLWRDVGEGSGAESLSVRAFRAEALVIPIAPRLPLLTSTHPRSPRLFRASLSGKKSSQVWKWKNH